MSEKRLVRNENDQMFFGVASGLADYVGIDPVLVRLLFVLMALAGGHGVLIYIILAIIMPESHSAAAKVNGFDEEEIVIKDAA
ncbi:MAG: PspC domain-containing protein [Anaerolineae bacterium]